MNSIIKKYLSFSILLIFLTIFILATSANAGNIGDWAGNLNKGAGNTGLYETGRTETTDVQLARYIGLLTGWTAFLGLVFLIHFSIAAYQWMTAQGNTEKIEAAKKRIKTALIGSLILLALYAIAYFFIQLFFGATSYNINI